MSLIKLSQFVKLVPEAARPHLPASMRKFKVALMPWLSQLYYDDKLLHFELAKLPTRYGDNRMEIGFHFESRNSALNSKLLAGFDRYLFEVREALGEDWWAEQWDRGWTKVYSTFALEPLDEEYVEKVGEDLAKVMMVLYPIYKIIDARL
jgi:hypothetical protein